MQNTNETQNNVTCRCTGWGNSGAWERYADHVVTVTINHDGMRNLTIVKNRWGTQCEMPLQYNPITRMYVQGEMLTD